MNRRLFIRSLASLFIIAACHLVNAKTYRVVPGDSLFAIAKKFGTTTQSLMQQNGLNGSTIYPGQILRVGNGRSQSGSSSGSTHLVKAGDSLYLIAQRYGTTVDSLVRANGLSTTEIRPGQRLKIPAGSGSSGSWAYTVKSGDTLYLLAKRYGTSTQALRQANGLKSDMLYPGQRLTIPSGGSSSSSSSSTSLSQSDRDLLARLVSAEAAGEPYAGQVAVAATILNRLRDPRYPNTIAGVIYQYSDGAYQFSPVMDGRINEPAAASAYTAVQDAIKGWDPSYGATGFYNPAKTTNSWVRSQPVTTRIGDHVFFKY